MIKHHGEHLNKILRQKQINITELAEQIGYSRQAIHNWFDNVFLSDKKWQLIGDAIHYDFMEDLKKKPYKPIEESNSYISESIGTYLSNKINVSVDLNGDDDVLEAIIKKLTKINEVLKTV